MIVRDEMNGLEEIKRIKKQNKIDKAKGKRVNKKAELGPIESEVAVQAIDRNYKDILSSSPLKYRVPLDLYGTPTEK